MGVNSIPLILLLFGVATITALDWNQIRHRRSIDLSAEHSLISDSRLPKEITPNSYDIELRPLIEDSTFTGTVKINASWQEQTNKITLHAHHDLEIADSDIRVTQTWQQEYNSSSTQGPPKLLTITRTERHPKKPIIVIHLSEALPISSECVIEVSFNGQILEQTQGLFKGSYTTEKGEKKTYLATYLRPNNARRLFPCFDEPAFKVPFTVSISRPKNYTTLFNSVLRSTDDIDEESDYVVDHFETTESMSTFTFGFVITQLVQLNNSNQNELMKPNLKIWAREDLHDELNNIYEKITSVLKHFEKYFGVDFPLSKLDIVALPGFASIKPADNWGLIVFKENELTSRGYYVLAQELVYQWLGSWATPYWWSDAHVNKALAGFLATSTALEMHDGTMDGKWQMTVLYSIYYEFSKRYPHSRITGMKQETTCSKTELVLRMLNYTLGEHSFKNGLRNFIADRKCKTFFGDDVWSSLTKQAHADKVLCEMVTVNDIAGSWITKDRLPVVTVTRDYTKNTAKVDQRVYLRERPHDVPERDKMLWWIPLIVVEQDNLNFDNSTPAMWMKKTKKVELTNLPAADKFIIVNPEEIGPFPVNYDVTNWNLLATYLQTEIGRKSIPTYTRAKLLHDAWNLAYAGDLSFATAFNMTLFMKYEKAHLVWYPVFTFIDHIGRHIDMSAVHKKFETYVRILLTPLYEELGAIAVEGEEKWKENLRAQARTFLCGAGYRPCIEEAQNAFKKWMESEQPEAGNPVANQYICPVFKWGTQAEWEFGLERVINFPQSRKQHERTYLLKTLAGCPIQSEKIERLLNITILEENNNFSENDIFLIFSMLSGGSSGYSTLFNFLADNWDVIKQRFANKTNLWDNLISTATGVFTTQEGYDMVSELYVQRQHEFGSAEHIIEKSLKNIKEEAKWSDENLPIIEKWLDNFLETANTADGKFMAG